MLKKFLLASAILAATSTAAFADGPYVGASLGAEAGSFNLKDDSGSSVDFGGRGAVGSIFGGYGATVNQNIYLGGEVFANLTSTSADIKVDSDNVKDSIKNKYGYGISFIPGVMLSDHTMVYGRAGLVRSRFEVKESAPVSSSQSKTLTGGQLGIGIQTSLTQNVDLRGEYDYTSYRSANFSGNKLSPATDQFNLGLIYKFD
ncbi:outer membrane protein [Aquicella lusitana]|uniref:Opacity protein-like surface antigen n=1 Tax=Aquicella lusitana TaxID=254246 RepID=A0A370G3F9_9COXI|nr:outer membrane beta-barrel protein [Aquicella lusitana]RDI38378.1 opacity protein-like surface antigen [Aquicella lusitana]VVC72391.1 hypothetical protein AQULUS_01010 [Aquicella lusitana]